MFFMNEINSCTAVFNNLSLKYEGRGFSKNTSSPRQRESFSARTLEDFDRYYQSRPSYSGYTPPSARTAQPQRPAQTSPARRTSEAPVRREPVRTRQNVPARQGESRAEQRNVVRREQSERGVQRRENAEAKLPSQVKKEPGKMRRAAIKLADVSVGATRRNFKRLPAATLVTIVACMMSLILLVGSTVMTGDITNEYSELKNEVNALASEESKLATELDIKNDLRVIEDIAINKLGMVSRDLIVRNYVKLEGEDTVESFEEPEQNVGLSTLLSAIAGN